MGQAARTGMSVFVRGGGDGFAPVHAVVAGIRPSPPVLPFRSATASTSTAPTGPPPPASASFARPKELHRHWELSTLVDEGSRWYPSLTPVAA
uniref:Expressed protein n=1 Tax=Oryza sativa subsp. japonica TaxID=39947 RepID=H2KWV5_ORYSJ|nr:expressed protein [Oryza sativa Japonica Group]